MNYDDYKLAYPPTIPDNFEICILCERDFEKRNMIEIHGDFICNKCEVKFFEQPNQNDIP